MQYKHGLRFNPWVQIVVQVQSSTSEGSGDHKIQTMEPNEDHSKHYWTISKSRTNHVTRPIMRLTLWACLQLNLTDMLKNMRVTCHLPMSSLAAGPPASVKMTCVENFG